MKVIIFVTILVALSKGTFIFPSDEYSGVANKGCIVQSTGMPGVCVPFSKCKSAQLALNTHKIRPTHCSFAGNEPNVCCVDIIEEDFTFGNCRKSKIQCHKRPDNREYYNSDCWRDVCNDPNIIQTRNYTDCIVTFVSAINGELTKIGDYPYMAALGWRQSDNSIRFNCGGFLLTPKFVITAAHCADLSGDAPVVVRTGGIDLNNSSSPNIDITIARIIVHPKYNKNEAYNDIAIIELSRETLDSPRCMLDRGKSLLNNTSVISVGYGQTSFGGPNSNNLLKVDLTGLLNEDCKQHYPPNAFLPRGLIDSQLCAIDFKKEKTQDTCQGDSGGPLLLVQGRFDYAFLVGVTSFGHICGSSLPGVYTRVSHYMDWIESVVWP